MSKLFHFILLVSLSISQVQAILIREGDTDEASLDRAKAYPGVCRLEFMEKGRLKQGTGVLIKIVGDIGWVLTAQHNTCGENPEAPFNVRAYFENSEGRKFLVKPLACAVPRSGPMGILSCGMENDLSLIAYELPPLFNIDPIPLCSSTKGIVTYDPDAGISRGEGCIVGYGYHGINNKPESFAIDQKKRHASTYFMEYKRRSNNIWSLFSSLSIAPLLENTKSIPFFRDDFQDTQDVFMTRFMRNEANFLCYEQSHDWSVDPRLIAQDKKCISERLHTLQGLIQGGDSGGPLIVFQEGKPCVLGIISHEYTDFSLCFKNMGFSPVGYYRGWIESFLKDSHGVHFHETSTLACPSSSLVFEPSAMHSCQSTDVSNLDGFSISLSGNML